MNLKRQQMRKTFIAVMALAMTNALYAQDEMSKEEKIEQRLTLLEEKSSQSKLKLSGYIQMENRFTENTSTEDFESVFNIRRARLKGTYANEWGTAVLQIDATEKGVGLKDAYVGVRIPTFEWVSLQAGAFDRPFGYEISYSSSLRESPERSSVFRTIFPDERDMGAMLTIQGPKGSFLNRFKLDAGLFAGNGLATEDAGKYGDNHKDFIGRLAYKQAFEDLSISGAVSYYNGEVAVGSGKNLYKMNGAGVYEVVPYGHGGNTSGDLQMAKKEVFGVGATLLWHSFLGTTNLRGEYLWGTQAGLAGKSDSNGSKGYLGGRTSPDSDVYSRSFSGYYAILVQDIGQTKHSAVLKYDSYDPNTKVSGNNIANAGDQAKSNFGVGYLYRMSPNVRLMAYYDFSSVEKTNKTTAKSSDCITLRVQYKF